VLGFGHMFCMASHQMLAVAAPICATRGAFAILWSRFRPVRAGPFIVDGSWLGGGPGHRLLFGIGLSRPRCS